MGDLVNRLRDQWDQTPPDICHAAADEIERLQVTMDVLLVDRRAALSENHDLWRDIERLRAALETYAVDCSGSCCLERHRQGAGCGYTARAALEGEAFDDAAT
jgi:hypothetical protein